MGFKSMDQSVPEQLKSLSSLLKNLIKAESCQKKLEILEQEQKVQKNLALSPQLKEFYADLPVESRIVLATMLALEQAPTFLTFSIAQAAEATLLPPSKWSRDIKER